MAVVSETSTMVALAGCGVLYEASARGADISDAENPSGIARSRSAMTTARSSPSAFLFGFRLNLSNIGEQRPKAPHGTGASRGAVVSVANEDDP